jgi:phage terminase large subunit-like protein
MAIKSPLSSLKLLPRNRQKVIEHSQGRLSKAFKPLPSNWADFARLCDIRSGDGVMKFNPYSYQVDLVDAIDNHLTAIISKTRQLGITETVCNYFLFNACKNPGYLGVIFSKTQSDTSNIAKRLRRQIESISEYTVPKTDSLQDIELVNGGRLLFRNSTVNGSRGLESVTHILFDEAAFTDDIEEIYKATIPTTAMSGDKARIILLSTPNGQSGFYFDRLNGNNGDRDMLKICESIRNQSVSPVQIWSDDHNWCKALLHWFGHPNFKHKADTYLDEIEATTGLSRSAIEQEYNLSFTETEQLVFNPAQVRQAAVLESFNSNVDRNCRYYIGIDTAMMGDDYTVAIVLKLNGGIYSIADQYRNRRDSTSADVYRIGELIEKYQPDVVGIETNGAGQVVLEQLTELHPSQRFQQIVTSQTSKQASIERLILAMDKQLLQFQKNNPVVNELLAFAHQGLKMGAPNGKHDDCVMSLAFALAVSPFKPGAKSLFAGVELLAIEEEDIDCRNQTVMENKWGFGS